MFTDTHCHILKENYDNIHLIMNNAKAAGINRFIVGAYNETSSLEVLNLINQYSEIYGTVGLHPENCQEHFDDNLFNNLPKKIVAIGEIGLDYHYEGYDKAIQLNIFNKQLKKAEELNLPVVVHSRDATLDTIETLKKYHIKGVIHSFSGSYETAQIYLKMGFKLGINGVITFKNSHLKDIIARLKPSDIVLETDAPYLTPEPLRGTINEPANIKYIAQYVANIFNISITKLTEITNNNIRLIFDI